MAQKRNNLVAIWETWVRSLGQEDPLGEGNACPLQYSCLENSKANTAEQLVEQQQHVMWASPVASGKESTCKCRRCVFDPGTGKIPWRRKWQPTPVFLAWEIPRIDVPGVLQSMGSQIGKDDLVPQQQQQQQQQWVMGIASTTTAMGNVLHEVLYMSAYQDE